MVYSVFWMFFLVLWTMNLIFWRLFHFWGWVFSDWDGVIGILDCDYVILDNYFLFEGENMLFLIVYSYFIDHKWYLVTSVFVYLIQCCVFYVFFVFGMLHFRGPTVRGPICHFFRADSWAPDNRAPGYFCYFFMICDFFL